MICAIPYGGNVSKLLKWTAFVFIGSRKSSAFRVFQCCQDVWQNFIWNIAGGTMDPGIWIHSSNNISSWNWLKLISFRKITQATGSIACVQCANCIWQSAESALHCSYLRVATFLSVREIARKWEAWICHYKSEVNHHNRMVTHVKASDITGYHT